MAELHDPRLGQTVEGRYHIGSLIADGGMATVYLATDTHLERQVALKLIHQQLAAGPHGQQFLHRFHVEATSAARIADPHIVQVYDTGIWDGLPYLVMEYVRGTDLRHRLAAEGTLDVRESLRILTGVLEGLSAAHQAGIIHRDIKPENILLTTRGRVKITDFGLAKALGQNNTGTTGLLLGTASYLSPETVQDNVSTASSDIYAVGIMAYEMLAGSVPFASSNAVTTVFRHVNDDVPPVSSPDPSFAGPLSDLVGRLCERDLAKRPADGTAALGLLRRTAAALPAALLSYRHIPAALTGTVAPAPLHSSAPVVHCTPVAGAGAAATVDTAGPSAGQTGTGTTPAHPTTVGPVPAPPRPQTSQQGDPTRAIAHVAVPTQALGTQPPAHGRDGAASRRRGKKALIITATVLAILAVAAVGVWWWLFGPGSTYTVPKATDVRCDTDVCTLTGADWSSYRTRLTAAGIPYTTRQAFSDTVAKGHVISSSRKAGEKLSKRLGPLAVTLSKGEKQATVPANLLDCSQYPRPASYLRKIGFIHVTVRRVWSVTASKDCAVSSSVRPGTTTGHTRTITLTVSKGRKPVTIPDLIGSDADEAEGRLKALRLKVTRKEEYSDTVAAGRVVSLSPGAGSSAHWGDSVTLTVSRGPQTVTMPNLVGMSKQAAREKLEGMGFKVETKSSAIGELLHQVFSQSSPAGSQVRLRDSNGDPTVITLTCV